MLAFHTLMSRMLIGLLMPLRHITIIADLRRYAVCDYATYAAAIDADTFIADDEGPLPLHFDALRHIVSLRMSTPAMATPMMLSESHCAYAIYLFSLY